MSYRVLIPTAGTGSRLGKMTKYINKSLVSIANRPTISHIIEYFPDDAEFVIALGHKGNLVKEFLQLAYPGRKFFFSVVEPFDGPGSGLGLSIMTCQEYLQQPFIFISCDTLIQGSIPDPTHNWMGYSESKDITGYRTLEISYGRVTSINEKGIGHEPNSKPYIGISGIRDYESFWEAMKNGGEEAISVGESYGMRCLLDKGVKSYSFDWHDTGNIETLTNTRKFYFDPESPNILEKENESIWFLNGTVVKFSDDSSFIANRVKRASVISEFIPEMISATPNFYMYRRAEGIILSKSVTLPLFGKLLNHSLNFWEIERLNAADREKFRTNCMQFYKNKTDERIRLFYKKFDKTDGTELINGQEIPTLKEILQKIDWNWLTDGLPGRFHGDFHFENILYSSVNDKFIFLDWRQEFGGSLTTGDIYYDLAKLLHGLIICHELIAEEQYWVDWQNNEINFDFHRKQILVECEEFYLKWIQENGYDEKKVITLTAIVYLNIAALHHYPYSLLLYILGKKILYSTVSQ